ncbi:MAG: DNA mismatch repair protein MutS, partial [Clostridia bacterium]|nr:DNA mismatch repair protein MutS [Clostridia bacterium]
MAELTPMMRQYFDIKNQYKDYILFYRLGDFYEMFFEDAKLASRELELTLTGRDCGQEERAPMCGVPYHSAEAYIARLVRKGYKVAICEQVEDPKTAKGLVKREIVRMITPGTVIEASMLEENRNNFLACVFLDGQDAGVCFADISTGEVHATTLSGTACPRELLSELGRFVPRETLLGGGAIQDEALLLFLRERLESNIEPLPEDAFDYESAHAQIAQRFGITDFAAAGLDGYPVLERCIGGLLRYLRDTQQSSLGNLNDLQVYRQGQFMELDLTARRNLELCETMRTKEKKGSLLWVIDRTQTAMGSRLIRQWLEKPLLNP